MALDINAVIAPLPWGQEPRPRICFGAFGDAFFPVSEKRWERREPVLVPLGDLSPTERSAAHLLPIVYGGFGARFIKVGFRCPSSHWSKIRQ